MNLATAWIEIVPSMRGFRTTVNKELGGVQKSATTAGQQSGRSMSSAWTNALKAGVAVGGAAAGLAVSKALVANFNVEKINDRLAASLGASGRDAARYGKVTADLYRNAFGDSMEQVSETVGVVESSFSNLTRSGEGSLKAVSETALNFAGTFGTDVAESVQTVSTLISTGLVKDATQGFDLMTAAFQKVPASMRGELPEILHEYGVNFQALGFSGQESFSLLVNAASKGKFALDKTGDSLKEFTIRGSDMSKASQDAYAAIGLNAEEMSRKVAAGGGEARQSLQATAQGLLGISDPAERANTAIALFGTPLEDLSVDQIPKFLESLAGGSGAMAGFDGAAKRMGDTLNDNTATNLETFKRTLQGGFNDAISKAVQALMSLTGFVRDNGTAVGVTAGIMGAVLAPALVTTAVGWTQSAIAAGASATASVAASYRTVGAWTLMGATAVKQAAVSAAAWVGSMARTAASIAVATAALVAQRAVMVAGAVAAAAMTAAQWALNVALNANPIGLIIGLLVALVAGVVLAYKNSETFRNIVQAAWAGIQNAASVAWNILQGIFHAFGEALRAVGNAFQWMWNNVIQPGWSALQGAFTAGWGVIRGAIDRGIGYFTSLKNAVKTVIDFIINAWNKVSDIFDKITSVGSSVLSIINPFSDGGAVESHATGGYILGPGTGTSDSIPAMLSNGEFVVNAKATKRNRGLLEAINSGLPGFAKGGLVAAQTFAKSMRGVPYAMGGFSRSSIDCSGLVSAVVNALNGLDPFTSRMSTVSIGQWLAQRGWKNGRGGSNAMTVGWYDQGGGANGHTAGQFPGGVQFEAHGPEGSPTEYGTGQGINQSIFTHFMHRIVGEAIKPITGIGDVTVPGLGPEGDLSTSDITSTAYSDSTGDTGLAEPQLSPEAEYQKNRADNISGLFGDAAKSAVEGQVQDFLGVFSIGDSPPLLKAYNEYQKSREEYAKMRTEQAKYELEQQQKGQGVATAALTALNPDVGGSTYKAPPISKPGGGIIYDPNKGAAQWTPIVQQALKMLGISPANTGRSVAQIDIESGGNPRAVNNSDSNAAAGDPSKGLLQVIGSTFRAYRNPSLPNDQFHPLANVYAGMNYAMKRYGGLDKVWPTRNGYATGGWVSGGGSRTSDSIPALLSRDEFVVRAQQAQKHRALLEQINAGGAVTSGAGGNVNYYISTARVEDAFLQARQVEDRRAAMGLTRWR